MKNYVQRIVDVRPTLVLVEKTVSRIAQDMLLEHGITLVINVKSVSFLSFLFLYHLKEKSHLLSLYACVVGMQGSLIIYFFAEPHILKVGQEAWQLFHYLKLENLRLEGNVINYITPIIGVCKTKDVIDIG